MKSTTHLPNAQELSRSDGAERSKNLRPERGGKRRRPRPPFAHLALRQWAEKKAGCFSATSLDFAVSETRLADGSSLTHTTVISGVTINDRTPVYAYRELQAGSASEASFIVFSQHLAVGGVLLEGEGVAGAGHLRPAGEG